MTTTTQTRPEISEKVLDTIRALLARAEHANANEHEAAVCAQKVQQILLKHNLDLGAIRETLTEDERAEADEIIHETGEMGVTGRATFGWCCNLLDAVAYACYCKSLFYKQTRKVVFVGTRTDVAAAFELYNYLRERVDSITRHATLNERPPYIQQRTFRFSFIEGCSRRVAERLMKQRRDLEAQENPEQIEGLVSTRGALVKDYISEQWQKVKNVQTTHRGVDHNAFRAGAKAGETIDLRPTKSIDREGFRRAALPSAGGQ